MVEAQAAARVDRLDQDKNVVILRYIVKDLIEEVHRSQPPICSLANCSTSQLRLGKGASFGLRSFLRPIQRRLLRVIQSRASRCEKPLYILEHLPTNTQDLQSLINDCRFS